MKTRRDVFKTVAGASMAAAFSAPAGSEEEDDCLSRATLLASSMAEKHGGEWIVKFDQKTEFVLIFRKPA
ncbi:hypothetical protein AAE028_33815 [Sinorhizobium sp. CB9]